VLSLVPSGPLFLCTLGFGLALAFVQLGPKAGACLDLAAVFCHPLSLGGLATEKTAQPATLFRDPSVVAGERQTETPPQCGALDEI